AVVAVVLLSISACAHPTSPARSSGIFGTVLAGPTCPVERAESSCPPRPWSGTVRATDPNGKTYEATTDAQGNYSLSLPGGTYDVVAGTEGAVPYATPTSLVVTGGPMQRLDLRVDTGIR